ncbi:hypothetical protein [Variovorax sp. UMC13]|uniref:hypothetical protein n=1 Tax=Variovorax sp. UMC13 TaxID=1862326 RepID=UPI00160467D6|nr:hypothetical protein [Variovorax sp. UMC13]
MQPLHRLWISLTCLAALGGLASVASAGAAPVELAGMDLPSWVHGADKASGQGCRAVRARRPTELPQPWRGLVRTITMQCSPMAGVDKEPDASTESVATLRPGAATLRGIPVLALRLSESWAHGDTQYVLDAPHAEVAAVLGAYVKARCLSRAGTTVVVEGLCEPLADEGNGGSYTRTSEMGGTWLHPDPDDPRRTILADAWSE